MAFPDIPTVAGGRVLTGVQADTTATRTFPSLTGLTKNSGDILVALIAVYQSSTVPAFSGWSSGWTEFADSGTTTNMSLGAAWKVSTGTETGTISVTQAATITGHAAMFLLSIPNGSSTFSVGSIASNTTGAANPGSLGLAQAKDYLWMTFAAAGETATGGAFDGLTSAGANYSATQVITAISADVVGGVEAGIAFRQLNASSEAPGVWTVDTSNARNVAMTIVMHPGPVSTDAATVRLTLTPSGTEFATHLYTDSATVGLSLIPDTSELFTPGAGVDNLALTVAPVIHMIPAMRSHWRGRKL